MQSTHSCTSPGMPDKKTKSGHSFLLPTVTKLRVVVRWKRGNALDGKAKYEEAGESLSRNSRKSSSPPASPRSHEVRQKREQAETSLELGMHPAWTENDQRCKRFFSQEKEVEQKVRVQEGRLFDVKADVLQTFWNGWTPHHTMEKKTARVQEGQRKSLWRM